MPSKDTPILDFDAPGVKRMAIRFINSLSGPHWWGVHKVRGTRSQNQNAWLWSGVYPYVQAGLREAWGESLTIDDVHLFCREKFLSRAVVDKNGEVQGHVIKSTATLEKDEFTEYVEEIRRFAAEYLSTDIPDPRPRELREGTNR